MWSIEWHTCRVAERQHTCLLIPTTKSKNKVTWTRLEFTSLIPSPPQFKGNIAHCCGTRNKQVTTDLNSTSWNTGKISLLSAPSARHKERQIKMGWKKKVNEAAPFMLNCRSELREWTKANTIQTIVLLMRFDCQYNRGLTYTPGSVHRGVISLGTLAEVAANSIRAFTYTTETLNVWTLIQIYREERSGGNYNQAWLKKIECFLFVLCC